MVDDNRPILELKAELRRMLVSNIAQHVAEQMDRDQLRREVIAGAEELLGMQSDFLGAEERRRVAREVVDEILPERQSS